MKIIYYQKSGKVLPGIATEKGVIPVAQYLLDQEGNYTGRSLTSDDIAVLKNIDQSVIDPAQLLAEKDLVVGPCVPTPNKIICIGLNYRKHAIESGMAIPTVPVVFTKYSNTLTDFQTDVPLGPVGVEFDYEVELAVVIGKKCKHVKKEEALDYVLGYCVANDLSCRDL